MGTKYSKNVKIPGNKVRSKGLPSC
uniref:Uncharacterized protein n=1 Tax=Anguilla anguilla TaxID=7936 RepID=A0A0E9V1B0_ANGAN